ncbi:MAG: cyclic nucleotide-binding domain-containing protein, partial [Spirochaetes bacterium]
MRIAGPGRPAAGNDMDTESLNKIIALLNNIPVFSGLRDEDLAAIIPLLRRESHPANSIIIGEGDRGESMYILIEGMVKVARCGEGGEEISLGTLPGGAFFGEFSLIDNLPRSASVVTVAPTDLFTLAKSDFDSLLARSARLANVFYRNCLMETFSRFRNNLANFTFSQHSLREKSARLDEINVDLSRAKKIQNCFINTDELDATAPLIEGVRHSYVYLPCIDVGGDFLNATRLADGSLSIIIADVVC